MLRLLLYQDLSLGLGHLGKRAGRAGVILLELLLVPNGHYLCLYWRLFG